jgi:6-phospho-beta-glucosidase
MERPRRPIIAVVGGGVSVAALTYALSRAQEVEAVELRLAARNLDRLRIIARHCAHVLAVERRESVVTACRSVAEAADGADAVVLMVRVGGLMARAIDETFPDAFGIPGDEGLGPGGYANALRTLPVLDGLADELLRRSPQAPVLNLVAPLGLTTRLLLDRGLRAVGVCELPIVTERSLREYCPPDVAVDLGYAGFNHLGWFWPSSGNATEVFGAAVAAGLIDADVLSRFGAAPLKYYYTVLDSAAGARLGVSRSRDRAKTLMGLSAQALAEFEAAPDRPSPAVRARPTPWFPECVVPILASVLYGRRWQGYANLRNADVIPMLPTDVVIETAATFDGSNVERRVMASAVPPAVLSVLRRVGYAEQLVYRAWPRRDTALLEEALVEGPWAVEGNRARALAYAIVIAAGQESAASTSLPSR